jgi:hypothetical protein
MAFTFPSSPSLGDQFVSPMGKIYVWDGSWTTRGDTRNPNPFTNSFKYRSVYTRGYLLGGYKDSSPWKNVNRTVHSTDITTNLGDMLDYGASYAYGGYSDFNSYVYGVDNAFPGSGTYTSSVSMITETGRSHSSSWDTKTTRGQVACMMNSSLTIGYITAGESTATDKHNYVTEIMYSAGSVQPGPTGGSSYGNAACWFGEFKGWVWASGGSNLTFATESWSAGGTTVGTDGWGKALSTKHGFAYIKNGGNCVTSSYKINDTTGAQIRTDMSVQYSGEENYETGQNWGYCLGHYNGAQNNNTYKINSLTDTVTDLGSDSEPKGHAGASSGANSSASAFMLGGL